MNKSIKPEQTTKSDPEVLEHTIKTLANLNSLISSAINCKTENALIFHILNHTVSYLYYDRAILITANGKKILGISGTSNPSKNSNISDAMKQVTKYISKPSDSQILSDNSFTEIPPLWKNYKESSNKTSILWLPLFLSKDQVNQYSNDNVILILERWNNRKWQEAEIKIAVPLQENFSNIWKLHKKGLKGKIHKKSKKVFILLILAIIIFALNFYKVSERIVAPCEVAPENPYSVTTAIDGVVETILVHPGQKVQKDSVLVKLNQDIFKEELTAARQQVKITQSEFARTQAQAVNDLESRSELSTLSNQLKMDKTRLRIAQYKINKSEILAPASGVVMMSDPHEWEGKPVMTGERIMLIITPSENKIKIYLPLNDKIDFPDNAQVKIILNTDSATSREAHLTFLADHASMSPNGIPSFLAEAKFEKEIKDIRMGVQGTAIIYGKEVSLGYWLIRRPLAAIRNFTGI